jgi:hypothetical protein
LTNPYPRVSRAQYAAALAAPLLAALAGWLALGLLRPPAPLDATAPETGFSAARAMAHVEAIAREPRPVGSAAHERARLYVEKELRKLGVEPEVQETTAVRYFRGSLRAARVRNVLARVEGRENGPPLLLWVCSEPRPSSRSTPGPRRSVSSSTSRRAVTAVW